MKKITIIAVAAAFTTVLAAQVQAQYRTIEADGIAASPKVRQTLNERYATLAVSPVRNVTISKQPSDSWVAASPRTRQLLGDSKVRVAPNREALVVSTTRPVQDGIAASPRLRQQLNDQPVREYQVAPFK